MHPKPHIQPVRSSFDKIFQMAAVLLLLSLWMLVLYAWLTLPAIIPIHFNGMGKADGFGSKATLLLLPVFATLIFAAISWLNRHPQFLNFPVPVAQHNAARQYKLATRMLRCLLAGILIVFHCIVWLTYLTAKGIANPLGAWLLPLILLLLIAPVVYFATAMLRKT